MGQRKAVRHAITPTARFSVNILRARKASEEMGDQNRKESRLNARSRLDRSDFKVSPIAKIRPEYGGRYGKGGVFGVSAHAISLIG